MALDHNRMFYSDYILNCYILIEKRISHPDTDFPPGMRDFCGKTHGNTMSELRDLRRGYR